MSKGIGAGQDLGSTRATLYVDPMGIVLGGVQVSAVWILVALLVILGVALLWRRHRRNTALQRAFSRGLGGVQQVQGSVHPDRERLP
jgi:uncharacterized membrane protein